MELVKFFTTQSTFKNAAKFTTLLLLGGVINCSSIASQQPGKALNDEQSDPVKLGLMQGFPPPEDKRVMLPDSNFFSFPNLRWSVCNMRELLPTASIKRNPYAYRPLEYSLVDGIDEVRFTPTNSDSQMTWKESLGVNYTDGMT